MKFTKSHQKHLNVAVHSPEENWFSHGDRFKWAVGDVIGPPRRRFLKRRAAKIIRREKCLPAKISIGTRYAMCDNYFYLEMYPTHRSRCKKNSIEKREKEMFRDRDREAKLEFLTQHLPSPLPEIDDVDLSVLEEPMEKYA